MSDENPLTLEELRLLERYFSTLAPFEFLVKARNAMRELIALREGKTVDGTFLASFGPEVECNHNYEPHDEGPPSCSKCGRVLLRRRLT